MTKRVEKLEKTGETSETATIVEDDGDPATVDPEETIEIDLTTPTGAVILSLMERVDALTAELAGAKDAMGVQTENLAALHAVLESYAPSTFAVRSGMGRDLAVPLPPRPPGTTELVVQGRIETDHYGNWDALVPTYGFVWENPADRPKPLARCGVTGDGCPNIGADFSYCHLCPGMSRDALIERGVDPALLPVEDGA